jgi:DNA modification methylase
MTTLRERSRRHAKQGMRRGLGHSDIATRLAVESRPISLIKPNPHNTKTHPAKQVDQIKNSMLSFGFTNPLLVSEDGDLIAGHGRYEAARELSLETVPVIVVAGLSPAKRRALAIADNKIGENSGWDRERLAIEIPELAEVLQTEGLDVSILGFDAIELDRLQTDIGDDATDPLDEIDPTWSASFAVSKPGDLWELDSHRVLCGDAGSTADLARLMEESRADAAFLDPPYTLRIGGMAKKKRREIAIAAGQMSSPDYLQFLTTVLDRAKSVSREGAIHFVGTDWRHIAELVTAGKQVYGGLFDIAVWTKSSADLGSFYKNQHELIGVFRVGRAPNTNDVGPGRKRRSRSNVRRYAAVNAFPGGRIDELRERPTAKPVALVVDALKDCTRRNDIVLDTFAGCGMTVMAAERVGRRARAVEIEPRLVDLTVRRWQALTGGEARHLSSGLTFNEIERAQLQIHKGEK